MPKWSKSSNLYHEQVEMYVLLAYQHFWLAEEIYEKLNFKDGVSKEETKDVLQIVKYLREAAGLFEHAASLFPFALQTQTVDNSSIMCKGLSRMCVALAQEFFIVVAVTSGKSDALVAQLAEGVRELYGEIFNLWKTKLKEKVQKKPVVHTSLHPFLKFRSALYQAIALKYAGKSEQSDDDQSEPQTGNALFYYAKALKILEVSDS
eukprot:UN25773